MQAAVRSLLFEPHLREPPFMEGASDILPWYFLLSASYQAWDLLTMNRYTAHVQYADLFHRVSISDQFKAEKELLQL